ncbi:MAG: 16S rRNA (guanine(527)-N(7))-methyltransferase RsmG [Gammaproteobacteria bacterium]|nr:16S rRNA (guanine(527)-N(7))-methyltransferase RsmG [Gammaproteobacteria bacterium]MBU1732977.1 16S rRNA (guanine(527)-N(7))-methyltransferase RsmG [Gammaproteobacteria bacterium]MBU1892025.1 16S rRNA (guanine(527)-N(7))-methyltransferase RsmG [Gammaproteobacteria bacterium]
MSLAEKLSEGLIELGLSLSESQQQALLDYIALLQKWNKVYNLTAVREPENMLYQHLLDSLAVLPYVGAGRLLDVGTGGGLPGIVLAIARPELDITLLDSNQKKTTFLRQACIQLGLKNVKVECLRVDNYQPTPLFDMVISRAFSDLTEFVRLSARLCRDGGVLLAMKGVYPYDELAQLPHEFDQHEIIALNVPGLEAQRNLVILRV